jgi:hypothetical protein
MFSATMFTVMVPVDAVVMQVRFPRPAGPAFSRYASAIALLGMAVWGIPTLPWPAALFSIGAAVTFWARNLLVDFRPHSELVGDTVIFRTLLRTRRVRLTGAPKVRLRWSGTGVITLRVIARHGDRARLPILTVNSRTQHGLNPEELDVLREALAGAWDRATDIIRELLHLQAAHLRAGGELIDSPLRRLRYLHLESTGDRPVDRGEA